MLSLLAGVMNYHTNVLPGMREELAAVADQKSLDALMITCIDGRVDPACFASTNPGDLFVARNPGNIVPPFSRKNSGKDSTAISVALAIDRGVKDIIVCGHSSCAAMVHLLEQPTNKKKISTDLMDQCI